MGLAARPGGRIGWGMDNQTGEPDSGSCDAFVVARISVRNRLFSTVSRHALDEMRRRGLSMEWFAAELGRSPAEAARLLSSPGMTLEAASEVLSVFGAELDQFRVVPPRSENSPQEEVRSELAEEANHSDNWFPFIILVAFLAFMLLMGIICH